MVDATGGTERVALKIAKIQVERGHDVAIASFDDEAWQGAWQGVKLVRLQPYSLASLRFGRHLRLVNLIRSVGFDVVHLHEYLRTSFFGAYPRVMQFHNNPLDEPDQAKVYQPSTEILGAGGTKLGSDRRWRFCQKAATAGASGSWAECAAREHHHKL